MVVDESTTRAPAHTIAPQASLFCDIGEGNIYIVVVKVACGPLPIRKPRKSAPTHQEDVRPTIIVIVKKSGTTASRLDDIFFPLLIARHSLCGQPVARGDVEEIDPRRRWDGNLWTCTLSGLLGKHQASQQQKTHQERCD